MGRSRQSYGWAGSDRAQRLPADWPQRKAAAWRRDGDICWWCGRGGAGPGQGQIDHKTPGDDHSLANLAPIHPVPCHAQKTAAEGNQARWRHREQRPSEKHPGLL